MIDWFRIISDLERHLSLRDIAQQVGCDPSTVWRYKGDAEPKYSIGVKLVEMHKKHCVPVSTD